MKYWLVVALSLVGLGGSFAYAQEYYHDTAEDIVLKKSIIKAVVEGPNSHYLRTIESADWGKESFYHNVAPFAAIEDVLRETSGFEAVNNPLIFDGDKIEQATGRKISDVPGTGIVIYDGRTTQNRRIDYHQYAIIDGDQIWVETGKPFEQVPEQTVIIYDCLFPPVFQCGKKENVRSRPFPKAVLSENRPAQPTPPEVIVLKQETPPGIGASFAQLPLPGKIFFILLGFFLLHLVVLMVVEKKTD